MRCLACNDILNHHESTRKYAGTSDYLNLCDPCMDPIKTDIHVVEDGSEQDSELDPYEDDEYEGDDGWS